LGLRLFRTEIARTESLLGIKKIDLLTGLTGLMPPFPPAPRVGKNATLRELNPRKVPFKEGIPLASL
jgi:hypothetical protein